MKDKIFRGLIVVSLLFTTISFAQSSDYTADKVTTGGVISGRVTFSGQVVDPKILVVTKDKNVCGRSTHKDESLLVGENHGLKNVVVYLTGVKTGKAWSALAAGYKLDQEGCQFSPHIMVVPAGQTFEILNPDGVLHNIHTRSELNAAVNKAHPKFLKKLKLSFDQPEIIKVNCDVHNWMGGWIVVAASPYYVLTDEHGDFELDGVPADTYTLKFWHEKLGEQTQAVVVKPNETVKVTTAFQGVQ